jgi:transglutaminase/protease-like cytokinesis protein 3
MATERERREWHRKNFRHRSPKQSQTGAVKLVVGGMIILSILIALSERNTRLRSGVTPGQKPFQDFDFFPRKLDWADTLKVKPKSDEITSAGLWNGNYQTVDYYGKSIQYRGTSIEELAAILSQYAPTPTDKARIAYTWVTHNIDYDVQTYLSKTAERVTPEMVLQSRRAICSGYSALYEALASAMGLETVTVAGYAKGAGYALGNPAEVNHAWNAVKLDNFWYLVDATWGAGTVNGNQFSRKFNPFFFAPQPNQFVYSHLAEIPEWQLLSQPHTKEEFESWAELKPQFFIDNLRIPGYPTHTLQVNGSGQIIVEAPPDVDVIAEYRQIAPSNNVPTEFLQKQNANSQRYGNQVIVELIPWMSSYDLIIYSKKGYEDGHYNYSASYRVIAN